MPEGREAWKVVWAGCHEGKGGERPDGAGLAKLGC